MLSEALKKVIEFSDLSEQEMAEAIAEIMDGKASDASIAAFLTALRMKGETVDEITGAARLMREKAIPLSVQSRNGLLDIVGTGGDSANTFNISTVAAFVAAGAGVRVAKHGNRSVSSRCGSADVMEALGIVITLSPAGVATCIDEVGIGFLFAPTFHVAMRHVAPVRKALGIRTIFNILGPLTNPSDADLLLVGVYDSELSGTIAQVLQRLGKKRVLVVRSNDGLDEISVSAPTQVWELKENTISHWVLNPEAYGIPLHSRDAIRGGTAHDNAAIIEAVLRGKPGPYRDCVLLNAGAALMAADRVNNVKDGIRVAAAAIDSGAAIEKLMALKKLSQKLASQ